jgi:hypothetical protein
VIAASSVRSIALANAKLCISAAFLERLAQDLEDVPSGLVQPIEKPDTMAGNRHLPLHRHLPAAAQPHIRNGVM